MTNTNTNNDEFLTIGTDAIPAGKSDFKPLEEGAYDFTCVAMVKGTGTKYQSQETEEKMRYVFASKQGDDTKFIRTNWLKISLYDGDPQPSAMWKILKAWTRQPDPTTLIEKMGEFDMKYFLGKPIQLALTISKDGKWNEISSYMAPKKDQGTLDTVEIPEFFIKGDKRVADDIGYVLMDGATIKAPKPKDGTEAAPAAPVTDTAPVSDSDMPF